MLLKRQKSVQATENSETTPFNEICVVVFFCSSFCKAEEEEDCFNKENLLLSLNYDMAAKKRKKDHMNNNAKVPCE